MADDSDLDQKYFVDGSRFNCPYCNRRNIVYEVQALTEFDWTDKKKCYVYLVECSGCKKTSMHLSFEEMGHFVAHSHWQWFSDNVDHIDDGIFYSVPSSYHVINDNNSENSSRALGRSAGLSKVKLSYWGFCVRTKDRV